MAHGRLDEDGPWLILGLCSEHLLSFPFVVLLPSHLFSAFSILSFVTVNFWVSFLELSPTDGHGQRTG